MQYTGKIPWRKSEYRLNGQTYCSLPKKKGGGGYQTNKQELIYSCFLTINKTCLPVGQVSIVVKKLNFDHLIFINGSSHWPLEGLQKQALNGCIYSLYYLKSAWFAFIELLYLFCFPSLISGGGNMIGYNLYMQKLYDL